MMAMFAGYRALAAAVIARVPRRQRALFAETAIGRLWLGWLRIDPAWFAASARPASHVERREPPRAA